jgi:hypothetical protein
MIDIEDLIAESHEILSTKLLMEKHGVSRRTVVRWHARGDITLAGQVGSVHFYTEEEEKSPSGDKGEKRRKGEGVEKWFDPFQLQ